MSLKRYLLIIYALSLAGLLACAVLMKGGEGAAGLVFLAPVIALANTFVNVWPWARRVPMEHRTGFRAYRRTNVFMAIWAGLIVFIAGFTLVEAIIG